MRSEEFDNKVSELLRSREIEPAADSWGRLEHMLDESEKPKYPLRALWYVAAAIILVVFAGAGLLLSSSSQQGLPEHSITEEGHEDARNEDLEEGVFKNNVQTVGNEPVAEETLPGQGAELVVQAEQNSLASITPERPRVTKAVTGLRSKDLKQIVYPVQKESTGINDREIDELLANARATLEAEDSGSSHKVNAAVLLADVEDELDKNFKDKALQTLKNGFVKLRTAVAERNQ